MADVFISYSKRDRTLARELEALLEAERYTVWYDKTLSTGEEFSDEIARELDKARAVIVIWTPHSARSSWIKAEAGRASADRKLIPIKASTLGFDDIPLPFNTLHTEEISHREMILSAVAAMLVKPTRKQALHVWALKQAKLQSLTWFGVIGTALTVLSPVQPLITLAYWSHWIIENWTVVLSAFWSYIFAWITIRVPPALAIYLSTTLFVLSLCLGSLLAGGRRPGLKMKRFGDGEYLGGYVICAICFLFTLPFILSSKRACRQHRICTS